MIDVRPSGGRTSTGSYAAMAARVRASTKGTAGGTLVRLEGPNDSAVPQ